VPFEKFAAGAVATSLIVLDVSSIGQQVRCGRSHGVRWQRHAGAPVGSKVRSGWHVSGFHPLFFAGALHQDEWTALDLDHAAVRHTLGLSRSAVHCSLRRGVFSVTRPHGLEAALSATHTTLHALTVRRETGG